MIALQDVYVIAVSDLKPQTGLRAGGLAGVLFQTLLMLTLPASSRSSQLGGERADKEAHIDRIVNRLNHRAEQPPLVL